MAPSFNMTALAIHGSRSHNGVSRIHGGVSRASSRECGPGGATRETRCNTATNGCSVPTFLAAECRPVRKFPSATSGRSTSPTPDSGSASDEIPEHLFWSVRQSLKSQMLHLVRHRVVAPAFPQHGSEAILDRLLKFATVRIQRAHHRLRPSVRRLQAGGTAVREPRLAAQPRVRRTTPGTVHLAGKAHPADVPGQDLIRRINRFSRMQEFEGRVLLVENYDLRLARRLVSA